MNSKIPVALLSATLGLASLYNASQPVSADNGALPISFPAGTDVSALAFESNEPTESKFSEDIVESKNVEGVQSENKEDKDSLSEKPSSIKTSDEIQASDLKQAEESNGNKEKAEDTLKMTSEDVGSPDIISQDIGADNLQRDEDGNFVLPPEAGPVTAESAGFVSENETIVAHILVNGLQKLNQEDVLKLVSETKEGEPYSKAKVKEDLKHIADAGIVQSIKGRTVQNNGELYVVYDVVELSEIKDVIIAGNSIIPTDEIMPNMVTKVGDNFKKDTVEADIEKIRQMYADKGYVAIVSEVNNNNGTVTFHVSEARVEDIQYSGNKVTKDWVLDKLAQRSIKKGDFLKVEDLQKLYEDLYDTGFFKNVSIDASDGTTPGEVILKVDLKEDKMSEWHIGGGYSDQYKAEFVGGIRSKNLGGTGKSLNFDFGIGKGMNRFNLSYIDPYWRKSDTLVHFDLYKSQRDITSSNATYTDYTEKHLGGEIGFIKPISKDKKTNLFASFTVDDIKADDIHTGERFDHVKSNYLKLGVRRDTRDEGQVNGTVYEGFVSTSQKFFGSDNNWVKFSAGIKNYQKLSERDLLASRLELNYSPNNLSPLEQFSIGGANSLRALDEDAQRGNKSVLASLELRHDLSKVVQGVIFVDAGKAWNDAVRNSFKVGAGLGIRVKTAMGLLRLDAAKTSGEGWKYMFGIGQSF